MSADKHVIILGGGIGGLEAAIALCRKNIASVTLVDPNPVHIWKPSLHEFASGTIEHGGNLFSFIELSKRFGFDFIQSAPEKVERVERIVYLANGQRLSYDRLVVAIGSRANDFGTPGAQEHCLFLNSLTDANALHARFRDALIDAQKTGKPVALSIVGGGATGVQLAAELCRAIDRAPELGEEARRHLLKPTLIEAMPRLLSAFPESVSDESKRELEKLGFDVITNGMVSKIDADSIVLKDGRSIPADVKIWAAGVKAAQATDLFDGLERSRSGQLMVTPTLQTVGDDTILAIGDCAQINKDPVAPTAQAARQEGQYIGRIALPRLLAGQTPPPFAYHDRGAVVALARYNAWGMWPSKKAFGGHGIGARLARLIHEGLFRQHQLCLTGACKTAMNTLREHLAPNRPDLAAKASKKKS